MLFRALWQRGGTYRFLAADIECQWRSAFPGPSVQSLAACVRGLHADRYQRILANDSRHVFKRDFGCVVLQTQTAIRDTAFRRHHDRLDHQQSGARKRQIVQIRVVLRHGLVVVGRVLAHR